MIRSLALQESPVSHLLRAVLRPQSAHPLSASHEKKLLVSSTPEHQNSHSFNEGAEEDYAESLRWYAERSKPAAEGFEAKFARALEAIAANPDRYPLCDDRHRFYLLKR